ncbi:MAG: cofactor-independent phosphoglycerate mutase [Candidatus Omnitrophota bacterium]
MKYAILVADGMADYPQDELEKRTPLEVARTPYMDYIAQAGLFGRVRTIPDKMTPASDVANMSIFGFDPKQYYTGRGPLEAANLGIELGPDDVAFRCNLITVSSDKLTDYSSGHIKTGESSQLIEFIDQRIGTDAFRFYPGVSYRHIMVAKNGALQELDKLVCKPPHDICGQSISKNLPRGKNAELIIQLMEDSRQVLSAHEINQVRIDLKENPANMIWLWGQGKKPALPLFKDKYSLTGSVISAVDLIKGLGRILGLKAVDVEGATGYYDTNYEGKAKAALKALKDDDFVFVHVEAPDEAGHNGDLREKIVAIERFDQVIVGSILEAFKGRDDLKVLVLPDHATPVSLRTHTSDAVPFAMCGGNIKPNGAAFYNEKEAEKSNEYFDKGYQLVDYFFTGMR